MYEFLKFYDDLVGSFPLHLEISQCKICDWQIVIYKKGCADDYPNSERDGNDALLVQAQDADMEVCFARAYVALKDWLFEHNGGY